MSNASLSRLSGAVFQTARFSTLFAHGKQGVPIDKIDRLPPLTLSAPLMRHFLSRMSLSVRKHINSLPTLSLYHSHFTHMRERQTRHGVFGPFPTVETEKRA